MKVDFSNQNNMPVSSLRTFCSNSENKKPGSSFTRNFIAKSKTNFNELKKDEDKRYSVLGAGFAVAVLSVLGLGLLNGEDVIKLFHRKRKYVSPKIKRVDLTCAHGGPDIDYTKGPTAIADAWNAYIDNIRANRKNNNVIARQLKKTFAENAKKLDMYKARAEYLVKNRGGVWA